MNRSEILHKLATAEVYLCDVRRYLDSDDGINWVADKLRFAILFAMEAWLLSQGCKCNFGNGWWTMKSQFMDLAPKSMRSKVSHCLAEASFLEFDCDGVDEFRKPLSNEEWKKRAYSCLYKSENVVSEIVFIINK